jgi:hypothetical protein
VNLPNIRGVLVAALYVLAFSACANDPVLRAQNVELKAQALFAEYTIAEEAAVAIIKDAGVPDNIKAGIKQAHAQLTPLVEALEAQRATVTLLKIDKPEDVPGALLALNDLIIKLQPLVNSFSKGVK